MKKVNLPICIISNILYVDFAQKTVLANDDIVYDKKEEAGSKNFLKKALQMDKRRDILQKSEYALGRRRLHALHRCVTTELAPKLSQ